VGPDFLLKIRGGEGGMCAHHREKKWETTNFLRKLKRRLKDKERDEKNKAITKRTVNQAKKE